MTYPFAEDTLHWPTAKPFHLEKISEGEPRRVTGIPRTNYSGAEHVGTHFDAPFHFAEGKWTTDQIPLARTIGPGVIIDVRSAARRRSRLSIKPPRHSRMGEAFRAHSQGVNCLMYSGWGKYWSNRKLYFGTDEAGDVVNLHFPGFSKEAAEFLIRQRGGQGGRSRHPQYRSRAIARFHRSSNTRRRQCADLRECCGFRSPAAEGRNDLCDSDENQRRQRRSTSDLRPGPLD